MKITSQRYLGGAKVSCLNYMNYMGCLKGYQGSYQIQRAPIIQPRPVFPSGILLSIDIIIFSRSVSDHYRTCIAWQIIILEPVQNLAFLKIINLRLRESVCNH